MNDDLASPEARGKDTLIAKLRPEIEKPGNAENGSKVFTATCAGCHIFKNEGRNLPPNLTGMGAHGPADLLVHIVDPNRIVEPNFISVDITTRDGDSFSGIIDRENASELVLRDATTAHTLCVGERVQTESRTLEKKPIVSFDKLLDAAALGTAEVTAVESLAGRLIRLERRFDDGRLKRLGGGNYFEELLARIRRSGVGSVRDHRGGFEIVESFARGILDKILRSGRIPHLVSLSLAPIQLEESEVGKTNGE